MNAPTSNRLGRPRGARTRADVINLGAYRQAAQSIKARALAGSATDERLLAILFWLQPADVPPEQRTAALAGLLEACPDAFVGDDANVPWHPSGAA